MEDFDEGTSEIQQIPDTFEEHIEVVEQCIEETKDLVVGDVKDLIFESPLPAYIPSLPLGFEVEALYECKECGDQFVFKTSYQFHMERRSLLIRFDCPDCETVVRVYNRCNLLSHLRQHGDPSRLTFDSSRVIISPLPFNMMLIGPLGNSMRTEELSFPSSSLGISEQSGENEGIQYCSECNTEVKGEVREHFQGPTNGTPADHNYKCKYCHLILPTKCSLKAHERYHKQERPFVCPDCAKVFGLWASFCVHLSYCCFHLDKCVQYRCPACKVCCITSVALEVHILTMHVKNVFKCNACPIACFSLQALEVHKMKGHGQASLPTNAYQQCQLCPDRLIPKSRLLFHVIEHVRKPSVYVYGYQCSSCRTFYQKKSDFAVHKAQCTEQPNAVSTDTKNNVMVKVRNNTLESVISPSLLNGNIGGPPGSSEGSSPVLIDGMLSKNSSRLSSAQNKSNDQTSKELPRVVNSTCDIDNASKKEKVADKLSEATVLVTDSVTVAHNISSELSSNLNGSYVNAGESSHMCDRCKGELTNDTNSLNDSINCTNCSDVQKQSKICSPQNNNSTDNAELVTSTTTSTTDLTRTTTNDKNKNYKSTNGQLQPTSKRRRCSIALNGPCNKKTKFVNPSDYPEKDKYKCHICKTPIGTEWEIIQDHFAKEHKNFNLLVLSPKINKLETGNSNANLNSSRSGRNINNNTLKCNNKAPKIKSEPLDEKEENQEVSKAKRSRKKALPKEKPKEVPLGSGQLITTRSQKSLDGKYTCFKCKYQNDDVETFWSHIVTHKTDNRVYQCMECGMCFVVKPSFQKHLFISHRIKDVDRYIDDHHLCHQKPKKDVQDESEDLNSPGGDEKDNIEENQCRVCRARFDNVNQLNKHFRTHGMAFLMMKQQENRNTRSNK